MTDNPFFEVWTTPFGLPPFDRIRPEHFPPAFDRGMAGQNGDCGADHGACHNTRRHTKAHSLKVESLHLLPPPFRRLVHPPSPTLRRMLRAQAPYVSRASRAIHFPRKRGQKRARVRRDAARG